MPLCGRIEVIMNDINWLGNRVMDTRSRSTGRKSYNAGTVRQTSLFAPAEQNDFASQETQSPVTPQPTRPMPQAQPSEQPDFVQGPPPSAEVGYIPYFLTQNIGKSVRAEFIIGNNQYADKTGILLEVGINYFVLDDVGSRTHIMCDLYSVKFVTILNS
jgi:hypothetical protein